MNQSDDISALALALSQAQGQITDALRDSENPFFKSRYADLASVWDACRKPLSDNQLALVQSVASEGERYTLETILMHSSGQYVSNTVSLILKDASMQGMGSAITYARRYQLAAFVGVAPDDDDDGNAASAVTSEAHQTVGDQEIGDKGHWCVVHNIAFFKRGKMPRFAHPYKSPTGETLWCNEPTDSETSKTAPNSPIPTPDKGITQPDLPQAPVVAPATAGQGKNDPTDTDKLLARICELKNYKTAATARNFLGATMKVPSERINNEPRQVWDEIREILGQPGKEL